MSSSTPVYTNLPTMTSWVLPGAMAPAQILTSSGAFSLPSNVVASGSSVSTTQLIGTAYTAGNVWNTYLFLNSGSATTLATSGSVYWFDFSPDGTTWLGTGSAITNSGSTNIMNAWVILNFSGSSPYWRFNLLNQSGSAITAKFVMIGR